VSKGIAVLFLGPRHQMGWGSAPSPGRLYAREKTGTPCTGGWVGPRAGLDRRGKSRPPPGFDPRTVQPVASRYTVYATRPLSFSCNYAKNAKQNTFPAYRLPRLLLVMKSNNKICFYLRVQNTAEPSPAHVSEIVPQYQSYKYQKLLQIPVETSRHGLLNLFKPTVQRILTCTIHSTPRRVYCMC